MEEDIKILKEFITEGGRDWKCIDCGFNCKGELKAIENILNRLEQLEEENTSFKKQVKLLKDNFKEALDEAKKDYFVPKSVIREKIEEYREKRNKLADGHFWDRASNINEDTSLFIAGEVLKELLGEE